MSTTWTFWPADDILPAAQKDWLFTDPISTDWTLARTAAALGRNSAGRWVSFAANVPRTYYDPATLTHQGILIEPTATQLVFKSRSATGSVGMVANNTTITNDTAHQTPFGLGATKIVPTTVNAQHGYNFTFGGHASALADNAIVSFQAYLKPIGAYKRGEFFLMNRASVYSTFSFTMDGAGSIINSTGVVSNISITPDVDGFFLLRWTMSYGVGTVNPTANLLIEPDIGSRTHIGDGTSGFYLAYFGAEAGSEFTSPILSDGVVAVDRPADIVTGVHALAEVARKSLGIQYTPLSSASQVILYVGSTDVLELRNQGLTVSYLAITGAETVSSINGAAPAPGVERTVVLTATTDEFGISQNGAKVGTDPTGPAPTEFETFRIGAGFGGVTGAGAMILKRIKFWPVTLESSASNTFSSDLSTAGDVLLQPVLEIQPTMTILPSQNIVSLLVNSVDVFGGASVNWRIIPGTAADGVDYIADSGTAIIFPGESTAEITVNLTARSGTEDRTFTIEILNPVDASIGNARCVVTLLHLVQQGPAATIQSSFTGALPAEWSLTRSTVGRTRNVSGNWASIAINAARNHYIAPGVSGLLIEPAATDQCLFDSVDPGFTLTASTKTMDSVTAVSTGTRTLQWRKDATEADHKLILTLTSGNSQMTTGEFTAWMIVKPVGRQYWRLRIKGIDNIWSEARFDLSSSGSVPFSDSNIIATVEQDPFFPTWYRIGVNKAQGTTAGVSAEIELVPLDDALGIVSIVGNTAHGIDIQHVQVEPGSVISSPIIVTGAVAKTIRAADVLKATGSWYQLASYSLGIRFMRLNAAPSIQTLFQVRDTANSTTADLQTIQVENGSLVMRTRTGSTTLSPVVTGGTAAVGTLTTAMMVTGSTSRIAMFDQGVKRGEVVVGAGGVTAPVAPTVIRIGSTEPSGLTPGSILLQAVFFWNTALTDTDATLLSGNLNYSPPAGPTALPVLSIPTALSVKEGLAISVPVTKTGAGACSVNYRTRAIAPITLGVDYTGVEGTLSFGSGETEKTVSVQTLTDAVADGGETFRFELLAGTEAGATLGNAISTITITETPVVSLGIDFSVQEGGVAVFNLIKTGVGACSVSVITQQVTATVGVDYTGIAATVINFGATETNKTVSIQTLTDAVTESSGETFRLNASLPVGCTLGNATCTCTISDAPVSGGGSVPAVVGFATASDGGIGQPVYYVTSLEDPATLTAGTLRHALRTGSGNKLIVFEVGGVIKLTSDLSFSGEDITIAGETAPYPGITVRGDASTDPAYRNKGGNFQLNNVKNFTCSHIVFERCHDNRIVSNSNGDALICAPANFTCTDIWFDHCATFWSNDEAISFYHSTMSSSVNTEAGIAQRRVSMTNTMICEPLTAPETMTQKFRGHYEVQNGVSTLETNHNYGLLFGWRTREVDVQHCLFTDMRMRMPFIDEGVSVVLANNIGLNTGNGATIEMNNYEPPQRPVIITCVGYLVISGPNSGGDIYPLKFQTYPRTMPTGTKVYATGLYGWKGPGSSVTPKNTIGYNPSRGGAPTNVSTIIVNTKPLDFPTPVTALTDQQIYDRFLLNGGPRPKENNGLRANPAVARKIRDLRNKTGKFVNHQLEVNGPSELASTTRSLRNGTGRFADGTTVIPAFPTATDKVAVRAWLRRFKNDVQYD